MCYAHTSPEKSNTMLFNMNMDNRPLRMLLCLSTTVCGVHYIKVDVL